MGKRFIFKSGNKKLARSTSGRSRKDLGLGSSQLPSDCICNKSQRDNTTRINNACTMWSMNDSHRGWIPRKKSIPRSTLIQWKQHVKGEHVCHTMLASTVICSHVESLSASPSVCTFPFARRTHYFCSISVDIDDIMVFNCSTLIGHEKKTVGMKSAQPKTLVGNLRYVRHTYFQKYKRSVFDPASCCFCWGTNLPVLVN